MRAHFTVIFALIATVAAECQGDACDADGQDNVILLQSPNANEHVIKAHGVQTPATSTTSSYKVSAVAAEFVAMTLFVIIGCGSAMGVAKDTVEAGWVLQVALTFGLAISSLAYAIGHYSGGQINCAVTFALVLTGQCSVMQGVLNFVAQLLGAIFGAFILTQMHPEDKDATHGLGTNSAPEGRKCNAFIGEFMMTFLLVFVVLETATNAASAANRQVAALAIGFAVFLAHSVLIPIDGCSINPTRSLGPAIVRKITYKSSGSFDDMWIFWAGPLLGAGAAAFASTQLMKA